MNTGVIHETMVALTKYREIPLPSTITSFMYRFRASDAITKKVTSKKYCNSTEITAHKAGTGVPWIAKMKEQYRPSSEKQRLKSSLPCSDSLNFLLES